MFVIFDVIDRVVGYKINEPFSKEDETFVKTYAVKVETNKNSISVAAADKKAFQGSYRPYSVIIPDPMTLEFYFPRMRYSSRRQSDSLETFVYHGMGIFDLLNEIFRL